MGGEEEEDVWERKEESSRSRAELDKTFGFGWKAGHCLANHSGVKLSSRGTSDDDLGRIDVKAKRRSSQLQRVISACRHFKILLVIRSLGIILHFAVTTPDTPLSEPMSFGQDRNTRN